jgi:hypothetical protein
MHKLGLAKEEKILVSPAFWSFEFKSLCDPLNVALTLISWNMTPKMQMVAKKQSKC